MVYLENHFFIYYTTVLFTNYLTETTQFILRVQISLNPGNAISSDFQAWLKMRRSPNLLLSTHYNILVVKTRGQLFTTNWLSVGDVPQFYNQCFMESNAHQSSRNWSRRNILSSLQIYNLPCSPRICTQNGTFLYQPLSQYPFVHQMAFTCTNTNYNFVGTHNSHLPYQTNIRRNLLCWHQKQSEPYIVSRP